MMAAAIMAAQGVQFSPPSAPASAACSTRDHDTRSLSEGQEVRFLSCRVQCAQPQDALACGAQKVFVPRAHNALWGATCEGWSVIARWGDWVGLLSPDVTWGHRGHRHSPQSSA